MTRRSCSSCWSPCPRQYTRSPNICDGRSACYGRRSEDEVTRRMSAILGEYSPAGQGCTRHFSVPPLEYKNSTSYKKYRPNFGLNIQESYGKRPIGIPTPQLELFGELGILRSCRKLREHYSLRKIQNSRRSSCGVDYAIEK